MKQRIIFVLYIVLFFSARLIADDNVSSENHDIINPAPCTVSENKQTPVTPNVKHAKSFTPTSEIKKWPFIWSVKTTQKKIALTFDDGPKGAPTTLLLDVLREAQVRATFFVVGREAEQEPDLIYRMYNEGHEIGNHTYTHKRLDSIKTDEISQEITKTNLIIKGITGQAPQYIRPPGGKWDRELVNVVIENKMKLIMWDINADDYVHESPFYGTNGENPAEKIYAKVKKNVRNGSIILMHNGSKESIKILPDLIKALKKEGYQCVTVTELIKSRNAKNHP